MTLRRNNMGQLGFHVQFEGLIADVEVSGFAWQAGLRQGSRLVEVCTTSCKHMVNQKGNQIITLQSIYVTRI